MDKGAVKLARRFSRRILPAWVGHQHFLQSTLPKIRRVSQMIEQMKPDCELGVDGGIDDATAPLVVAAGANVLVAGSSIFATRRGVEAARGSLRAAITQVVH
jgi:ribulose-phosphate 3-epimerase